MRPQSIRKFDLFYLASLAVSVVGFLLSYDAVIASVQAETAASGTEFGTGLTIGSFVFVLAVYLLAWFLVSRKRLTIAKWIVVALVAVNLASLPALFSGAFSAERAISLASLVLAAVALYYLFQPDTKAWLAGDSAADPAEHD